MLVLVLVLVSVGRSSTESVMRLRTTVQFIRSSMALAAGVVAPTVIAMICLALPPVVSAAGLRFLKDSPLTYFTAEDRKMMQEAAYAVLDDPDAAAVREWKNPKNEYSGKVEGLGEFHSADGLRCRKIRILTRARGTENVTIYPVCKTEKGEWQISSGRELTAGKNP